MSAALLLLLALLPDFGFSYNMDTSHPIIYGDPVSGGSNYFGYSVSLSSGGNGASSTSLFVGAPQFSNGTGRVYRCTKSSCQPLGISVKDGTITGWLGASMATGETGDFTACAPRTLVPCKIPGQPYLFHDLHGVCYYITGSRGNILSRDYDVRKPFSQYDFNIAHGFSVHYDSSHSKTSKQGFKTITRIIGQPGLSSVDLTHSSKRGSDSWKKENGPLTQGLSRLGYSVSSGYYFGTRQQLLFAAGAPAWSRKGIVMIFVAFQLNSRITQIEGSVLGEYFGGSLTTGDFDNDGYDDLAIGAPHWGEVDFGRVYIYHGNKDGSFRNGQILEGKMDKGMFGYTLASADLDRDGFSDLVVAAPWEESGAVYVYYGSPEFGKKNPLAQIIQTIKPSEFNRNYPIQRFGFSLSHPVDFDDNGYPDLAIGAYKSGHAIVLRSRPVINTKIELESYPTKLDTSTKNFTVSVCVLYDGKEAPESQDLSFSMTVDAMHNRIEKGYLKKFAAPFFLGKRTCTTETISLITSEGRNNVDPIEIDVIHSIKRGAGGNRIDAVLNRTSLNKKWAIAIPFNTGCKGGQVCHAQLSVAASFRGVGEENMWVVGSEGITLDVVVTNEREPAYLTRITIGMPPGIRLRKTTEYCEESITDNTLTLSCLVANPLQNGQSKSLDFDLDMRNVTMGPTHGTPLIFNITRSTQSHDEVTIRNPITTIVALDTKNIAHVTLTGVTDKKNLDYGRAEEKSKILIRHTYRVLKSGPSPISEAYLHIDVPTSMIGRSNSFLNISDPKLIENSGKIRTCSLGDARSDDRLLLRRRRRISGSSTTEETLSVDDELRNDAHNEEGATELQTTKETIYLNCSTEGVSCTRLSCRFKLLNTNEDVQNVILDMIFDTGAFYSSDEESLTVTFHTNASAEVTSPFISDVTYIRSRSAGASTMLYNIPEPKKLARWILPSSIVLGILLFCILAIILFRVGFFKRSDKLETAKAKETELMLNADNAEEFGTEENGAGDTNHSN